MTAVETLREAADRLRGYVQNATHGPWVWAANGTNNADVYHRIPDVGTVGVAVGVWTSDAHYIAAMHPGVGLLLVELLDSSADAIAMAADDITADEIKAGYGPEIAVATAVLGGAS